MKKIHGNSKYHEILTKEFLYTEYIINKKSTVQIAKELGCNDEIIRIYLIKNNIKIRTHSEIKKGKNNPNYTNGCYCKPNFCIDCGKSISISKSKRCPKHAIKYNWKKKEYREKIVRALLKANNLKPNKPEIALNKLLNKLLFNQYRFVGNGKLIIGGFCPDFVNKDNNRIIEMYGCYWHKCLKCGFGNGRTVDVGRLKEYKKADYKTLIIWEHELKNINEVENKISEFSII